MKDLKNVDIICANSVNPHEGTLAIQYCQNFFNFGRSILFTDIEGSADGIEVIKIDRMNSVNDYNNFMLKIGEYLDNEYVLVVQDDGHIVNPDLWDDEFLNYDYIGAPWPAHVMNSYIPPQFNVGNGGFCIRSKRLMEFVATDNRLVYNSLEDFMICQLNRAYLEMNGFRFAPEDIASKFSWECGEFRDSFGVHQRISLTRSN